jgi:hypothetical protein
VRRYCSSMCRIVYTWTIRVEQHGDDKRSRSVVDCPPDSHGVHRSKVMAARWRTITASGRVRIDVEFR